MSDLYTNNPTRNAGVLTTHDPTTTQGGGGATGEVKYWTGSVWTAKPVKYWTGSQWITKPLKRWNGSQWITTPY